MADAALAYEPETYYTDIPVGEILRRARLHYGQSLEDIERNLRIRAELIEAIEKGDSKKLPGRVYAIGFVRSYAEYLGLDGEKMVQLFKVQSVGVTEKPELNFPVAASDSKVPSLWLVGGSVALGILLLMGWGIATAVDRSDVTEVSAVPGEMKDRLAMNGESPKEPNTVPFGPPQPTLTSQTTDIPQPQDIAAQEAAAAEEAAQVEPAAGAATATTAAAQAAAEPGIILNLIENSWVEIRDGSGKSIVSRVLKAGDQYFVPDRPGLSMSIGNAGGVEMVIDGKALPLLGRTGEIRRNIPLNSKALKESL